MHLSPHIEHVYFHLLCRAAVRDDWWMFDSQIQIQIPAHNLDHLQAACQELGAHIVFTLTWKVEKKNCWPCIANLFFLCAFNVIYGYKRFYCVFFFI